MPSRNSQACRCHEKSNRHEEAHAPIVDTYRLILDHYCRYIDNSGPRSGTIVVQDQLIYIDNSGPRSEFPTFSGLFQSKKSKGWVGWIVELDQYMVRNSVSDIIILDQKSIDFFWLLEERV